MAFERMGISDTLEFAGQHNFRFWLSIFEVLGAPLREDMHWTAILFHFLCQCGFARHFCDLMFRSFASHCCISGEERNRSLPGVMSDF